MLKINNDEIKIIVSDYDWTLHDRKLPPQINFNEIKKAIENGCYFAINTGNLPYEMENTVSLFSEINNQNKYIICCNGNVIHNYLTNESKIKSMFDKETIFKMIDIFQSINAMSYDITSSDLNTSYYNDISVLNVYLKLGHTLNWKKHRKPLYLTYFNEINNSPKITLKNITTEQKPKIIKLIQDNFPNLDINATWFMETGVDFQIKGPTKFTGIQDLLVLINQENNLNLTLNNVLYFGDHHNDLECFQNLKYCVAVNNAIPEIKKLAYEITDSAENGGVGKYLQKISQI